MQSTTDDSIKIFASPFIAVLYEQMQIQFLIFLSIKSSAHLEIANSLKK